jgi:hypothetical protein
MPRLLAQLDGAGNMTDVMAALGTLANLDLSERDSWRSPPSMRSGKTKRWWSTNGCRCKPPRACPAPRSACAN